MKSLLNMNQIEKTDLKVRKEAVRAKYAIKAGRKRRITEHFLWEDMSQPNPDVPDNLAFFDMGLADRFNVHLDGAMALRVIYERPNGEKIVDSRRVGAMNDRDFRERCVVHGDRLYALYLKGPADFQKPSHRRIEKLAEWLSIDLVSADLLAQAIESLELDYRTTLKMIHGYTTSAGKRKHGLKSLSRAQLTAIIVALKDLADQLPKLEPQPFQLEEYRDDIDPESEFEDDLMDTDGAANAFGAFPLAHPKDGLKHGFLSMIEHADRKTVNKLQAMMFPQEGRRAKLYYLSSRQRSQFWECVTHRKCQLFQESLERLDQDGKTVVELIYHLGTNQTTKALVMAYLNGAPFDLEGTVYRFDKKQPRETCWVIWKAYKDHAKQEEANA